MNGFFLLRSVSLLLSMLFSCCDKIIMSNRHKRGCRGISYFHGITNEIEMLSAEGDDIFTCIFLYICQHLQIKSIPLTTHSSNSLGNNNKMWFPLIIIQMYFVNKQTNKQYPEFYESVSLKRKKFSELGDSEEKPQINAMDGIKFELITLASITYFLQILQFGVAFIPSNKHT